MQQVNNVISNPWHNFISLLLADILQSASCSPDLASLVYAPIQGLNVRAQCWMLNVSQTYKPHKECNRIVFTNIQRL
jgi:hypothetical protein